MQCLQLREKREKTRKYDEKKRERERKIEREIERERERGGRTVLAGTLMSAALSRGFVELKIFWRRDFLVGVAVSSP